jgi:hypothetical protein
MGSGDGDGGESNSALPVRGGSLMFTSTLFSAVLTGAVFVRVRGCSSALGSRLGSDSPGALERAD